MSCSIWRPLFFIAVWTLPVLASTPVEKAPPSGKPISVKLVDVSMVDFLRVISEVSGLNIIVDPDVEGSLTINVEKVPWDQLMQTVLESHGLTYTGLGTLIRISRKETLQQREKVRHELKQELFLREKLLTEVRYLKYSHAKTLQVPLESVLTQRGQIKLDERTNALIIRDVQESIQHISRLIDLLDRPEQQVEIEARIVEVTQRFSKQLGVQIGFQLGNTTDRYRGGVSVIAPVEPAIGSASLSVGGLLDTMALDAAITAAEATGDARMISKPRVSTLNNAEARIVQGAKIPIPVQMNYTTNVRYETAALNLSVKPQITGEGKVSLEIKVENSVPDFSQTVRDIPTILTSESHTRVLVDNGATAIIGGIYVEKDRKGELKIPGIGGIPIIGRLFKRTDKALETREVLFFITSRIQGST